MVVDFTLCITGLQTEQLCGAASFNPVAPTPFFFHKPATCLHRGNGALTMFSVHNAAENFTLYPKSLQSSSSNRYNNIIVLI